MRRLTLIRYAVLILMRDVLIPGGGLFLSVYLPISGSLQPWHLPLIAGMLGTPLVARGERPPDIEGPDTEQGL
jgi:hypothetical protein